MNSLVRNLNTAQLSFSKSLAGLRYEPMYREGDEKKTTGTGCRLWETLKLVGRCRVSHETRKPNLKVGHVWMDCRGTRVVILDVEPDEQWVHYQLCGGGWHCRTPIFIFNARYQKVEG